MKSSYNEYKDNLALYSKNVKTWGENVELTQNGFILVNC